MQSMREQLLDDGRLVAAIREKSRARGTAMERLEASNRDVVQLERAADELYLCRPIAARRPWDTGPDAVAINSGQGFLDRDLAGVVEEWSVR